MKKILLISSVLILSVVANAQWTSQATGYATAGRGVRDICAASSTVVWVAAYDGSGANDTVQEVSHTTDGGTTWTPSTIPAPSYYEISNIAAAADGLNAWVIFWDGLNNMGGGIWHTADGGSTWAQQGVGTIFDANSFPDNIYFASASVGIAIGDPNGGYFEIYTTTDGGTTWTRVPTGNIPAPLSGEGAYTNQFAVVGTTIWFTTNKGRIFKSVNAGLNWTVASSAVTGLTDIHRLAFRDANNGIIALQGVMRKTSDGGATWTTVTTLSGTYFGSDLQAIPNSSSYVSTGAAPGNMGSSYTVDDGANWVLIDDSASASPLAQHTAQAWIDGQTGWCGGYNTSPTADGVFKFNGIALGVTALNRDNARMRVYPNPSNGQFKVQIGGAETKDAIVTIVDVVGSVVYEGTVQNNSNLIEKGFDLTGISKGVYFVNVVNGATRFSDKLIIK